MYEKQEGKWLCKNDHLQGIEQKEGLEQYVQRFHPKFVLARVISAKSLLQILETSCDKKHEWVHPFPRINP